jgi:hypothetical protein
MPAIDRIHRVVTAPCTIAMLITAACGGCAAVVMIAVDAIEFHSIASFVAGCAADGTGPVTVTSVVTIPVIAAAKHQRPAWPLPSKHDSLPLFASSSTLLPRP